MLSHDDHRRRRLLTPKEAANRLNITVESLRYYALRARTLPYIAIGRKILFLEGDLDLFVTKRRKPNAPDVLVELENQQGVTNSSPAAPASPGSTEAMLPDVLAAGIR